MTWRPSSRLLLPAASISSGASIAIALALTCAACSPALDWRTVRPDGGAVELLFPCRPQHDARSVRVRGLDGSATPMQMETCHADGATFSLAVADAGEATRVAPLMRALRAAAAANIDGTPAALPLAVPGATPDPLSGRLRIAGHLADRRPVLEDAAFFVRGARVYQASVVGATRIGDAADIFFGSIKVSP